jgi:hypothetical protein
MALQTRDSDSDIQTDQTQTETETETGRHERPKTFREKHALKVMGVIMAAMFALVVAVQVAC